MLAYEVSAIRLGHCRYLYYSELISLGDTMTLIIALLACLLGYGEVGLWLRKESKNENSWVILEGNPYKLWIDDYSGEIYQKAVEEGLGSVSILFLTLRLTLRSKRNYRKLCRR